MSDTPAVAETVQVAARCDTCTYSRKARANAMDIQGHLLCVRLPPVAIMMPVPGKAGMMRMASAHPPVSPAMMCYEFHHDPSKVQEGPSLPVAAAANDGN